MTPARILLAALVILAAIFDLRTRRIPNWLCAAGFLAGLALHISLFRSATIWIGSKRSNSRRRPRSAHLYSAVRAQSSRRRRRQTDGCCRLHRWTQSFYRHLPHHRDRRWSHGASVDPNQRPCCPHTSQRRNSADGTDARTRPTSCGRRVGRHQRERIAVAPWVLHSARNFTLFSVLRCLLMIEFSVRFRCSIKASPAAAAAKRPPPNILWSRA